MAEAMLATVVTKVSTKEVPFEQSLEGREDTSQMNGLRKGYSRLGEEHVQRPRGRNKPGPIGESASVARMWKQG